MTGKKARSLPDTGVPMSAALGAVTALTALLAGIGTVLAARRRSDHEAR
jgi:LPXTG-motif cell wall-anchored protein